MARPPLSTAGSSRPYTSNGARPPTATGQADPYGHRDPQYTYGQDYDLEEEEEESEDEDVFAFLPPTTAELEQQRQQQLHHDYPHNHPLDFHSDDPIFANSIHSPQLSYPSPTFDPYARHPADSISGVGPSTPHFQYFQPPPQTPPSTDSNNHNHNTGDDLYRLRRINTSASTAVSQVPNTAESREVRVSLPGGSRASVAGSEKEDDVESGIGQRSQFKHNESSITGSMSITHSMVDDDDTSREGSIK
ncbi:hypothetical protein BDZ94DRAFT_604346 [Collybia nuda]|uniref:Uncharacterized protein n=1 Tax=Collybia nuda TaxID=64659 RepID=A0A9P6CF55_9AGAR|nr:hypothetical protein BDZ94DRAFT_604346 [Collybia nuda]